MSGSNWTYCWVSITGCSNYGNRLIEACLRPLLNLKGDGFTVDVFGRLTREDLERINSCDFVVLPGCTMLQRYEHPAMEQLLDVRPPVYCFGGSFNTRIPIFPHPKYCKNLALPIGVRDPFTQRWLKFYGIPSRFIGCPTLFAGDAKEWKAAPSGGKILFNFGKRNVGSQLRVFEAVRRMYPVRVIIQDEAQRGLFDGSTDIVEFEDVPSVVRALSDAAVVVTGRLHAALPAIACGTPAVFSSLIPDSRMSLLRYLGVEIHNTYDIRGLVSRIENIMNGRLPDSQETFSKIDHLRKLYLEYIAGFHDRFPVEGGGK